MYTFYTRVSVLDLNLYIDKDFRSQTVSGAVRRSNLFRGEDSSGVVAGRVQRVPKVVLWMDDEGQKVRNDVGSSDNFPLVIGSIQGCSCNFPPVIRSLQHSSSSYFLGVDGERVYVVGIQRYSVKMVKQ